MPNRPASGVLSDKHPSASCDSALLMPETSSITPEGITPKGQKRGTSPRASQRTAEIHTLLSIRTCLPPMQKCARNDVHTDEGALGWIAVRAM